ncbi:MAG: hypothetical protein AAGC68_07300 [Verrucomicrobiota bacterium]
MTGDQLYRDFLNHCQAKWKASAKRSSEDGIVLGMLSQWVPRTYSSGYLANYLAERLDAQIEAFDFSGAENQYFYDVYEAMGCRRLINFDNASSLFPDLEATCRRELSKIRGFRTKQEILNLEFDGLYVGDLIYNSHCRYYVEATVDPSDPRFQFLLLQSLMIHHLLGHYFTHFPVKYLITEDVGYIRGGIPCRLAHRHGIPVITIQRTFRFTFPGIELDENGEGWNFKSLPCNRYRSIFESLDEKEQAEARAKGRETLEARLQGKPIAGVMAAATGFHEKEDEPVLEDSGRPRIVVFPHDFCDAIHKYGEMIYDDYLDWLEELLRLSSQTKFDWYVKPHPNSSTHSEREVLNRQIIEMLAKKYPHARFLEPTVSNRNLIEERIDAAFTVSGDVAHEFAYLGIPVVTAGNNPHMTFDFNIHCRSASEFEEAVIHADQLHVDIDRDQVEAFSYMHYVHFFEEWTTRVAHEPKLSFLTKKRKLSDPETVNMMRAIVEGDSAEADRILENYFDACFDCDKRRFSIQERPGRVFS